MKKQNVTARIGEKFDKELNEIKKARIENGLDKKKKSTRTLTDLITSHAEWPKIKEDTIELNLEVKK